MAMIKRVVMLAALGGIFLLGTACFGLFTESSDSSTSSVEACAGLSGQAKVDCEQRQAK